MLFSLRSLQSSAQTGDIHDAKEDPVSDVGVCKGSLTSLSRYDKITMRSLPIRNGLCDTNAISHVLLTSLDGHTVQNALHSLRVSLEPFTRGDCQMISSRILVKCARAYICNCFPTALIWTVGLCLSGLSQRKRV